MLTRWYQVVPQDSAILPGYIPIGIRRNHMEMTKFSDAEDPGFVAACGELRRWTKKMDMETAERRRGTSLQHEPSGRQEPQDRREGLNPQCMWKDICSLG